MTQIYKILPAALWSDAVRSGQFTGAAIDISDGYIHLSAADQVEETAARYFAGQNDLVIVAFAAERLGSALKWEASRGGALFPHLYATLDPALALWTKPLPWNGTRHEFPVDWR